MNIRNGYEMITPETYGFIYMTHNMVNGKKYIGQKKIDKRGRWKSYLGSGSHLLSAVRKYGANNFYKDIIDVANNKDDLDRKEISWIEQYNAVNDNTFYNLECGGYLSGANTLNYSDKTKELAFQLRSNMWKNYQDSVQGHWSAAKISEEDAKTIIQRLLNYETVKEICKDYPHIGKGAIVNIRTHKTWKYLTEGIIFPSNKEITSMRRGIPIRQYDIYGNYINSYKNARIASIELGLNYPLIQRSAKKKFAVAYGYIWVHQDDDWVAYIKNTTKFSSLDGLEIIKYAEQIGYKSKQWHRPRPVLQFDKDGHRIARYDTIKDAATITGIADTSILMVCQRAQEMTHGYVWRYEDEIIEEVNDKGGEDISA